LNHLTVPVAITLSRLLPAVGTDTDRFSIGLGLGKRREAERQSRSGYAEPQ
jgi:hypothetical protein